MILNISEDRKDKINKEFMAKEVRILTFECLLNTAAMLKKEKDENYRGEIPEENEYRTLPSIQLMPLWLLEAILTSPAM